MLSLVTNVSLADAPIVRHAVPSWLRVLGPALAEVVLVVDPEPPTGRIAALHGGHGAEDELRREVDLLLALDPRVRAVTFSAPEHAPGVARRWFRGAVPVRCQGGTPIAAMLFAIDSARSPLVLRADCDMLFSGAGWIPEARALLEGGEADLVEPPRHGMDLGVIPDVVSTRALVLSPERFAARLLPLRPHRVGPLRRLHRRLAGRAPWVSLEEMLQREREAGRLRHRILPNHAGVFSIHAYSREHARGAGFADVVARIEGGGVPEGQPPADWNLVLSS